MAWRQLVISAFVTLVVSILAGVAVWQLTKQPAATPVKEALVYRLNKIGSLGEGKSITTFLKLTIENRGEATAHDLQAVVDFGADYTVLQSQSESSAGPVSLLRVNLLEINAKLKTFR